MDRQSRLDDDKYVVDDNILIGTKSGINVVVAIETHL